MNRSLVNRLSLMIGTLIIALNVSQTLVIFRYEFKYQFESILGIGLFVVLGLLTIFGINLIIQSLVKEEDELKDYYSKLFNNIFSSIINLVFFAFFVGILFALIGLLLIPESIVPTEYISNLYTFKVTSTDPAIVEKFALEQQEIIKTKVKSIQILMCVCLSGLMGGFIRETYGSYLVNSSASINSQNNFWKVMFSIIGSLFLSFVFFLLLRAGVLESDKIDSFNLYGVTGISAVTGYFSDRVISRISGLYNSLIGENTLPLQNNQVAQNQENTAANNG